MVMLQLTQELCIEYRSLFNKCVLREEKIRQVDNIISEIEHHRNRYLSVGKPLGIPWYFIAVIHNMESSRNFTRHLHNGDPLTGRTVHDPKGRPDKGNPPFTWEQSATDALQFQGFDHWNDWSLPGLLYKLEEYNGWGYRLHHPYVLSPYLWSGSTHYTMGKYTADNKWSETTVSTQVGAVVLLHRMAEKEAFLLANPEAAVLRPEPPIRYSPNERSTYAEQLQIFLNNFPGISLKVDGYPGAKTSDACKQILGCYLYGDPRMKT